tara:strand:+ start:16469 stop:17044 length:576 start_codon:yes stop_codon:yes gene_type:complete
MFNVKYAILDKNTNQLLKMDVTHDSWDDGECQHNNTEYRLETDGEFGVWTSDCLVRPLVMMSSKLKDSFSLLPYVFESLREHCEIVAIHSFESELVTMSIVSSKGVEQELKNVLTDDEFLRAKYTSPTGEFDEQHYNHILQRFGTDCEEIYKIQAFDFHKISSYLELNNKTPKVECNVQGLKEKAAEIFEL